MRFVEKLEFAGDASEVWKRLSDLGTVPVYWHGAKEFKAFRSGEKVVADIIFAFGGKGRAEVTVDSGERSFVLDYFEGPFRGRQRTTVKEGVVESEWDVTFKGAYRILGPWNASHFRSGTKHALMRLCEGQRPKAEAPPVA